MPFAMKRSDTEWRRWLPRLVALVAGWGAGFALIWNLPDRVLFVDPEEMKPAAGESGDRYACAMMDFIGRQPGTCPVCGMQLVKVEAGELNREQSMRIGLETVTLESGPALLQLRARGKVRYDDRTMKVVIPRVAGRIVYRHAPVLHRGNLVEEGDPLFDLYSTEAFVLQGELAVARDLRDEPAQQALVERLARLHLRHVAEAVLAGDAPSDTVSILSPYAGLVYAPSGVGGATAGIPELGQAVAPDQPLCWLVDPHALIVVLQITEEQSGWVRTGQKVSLIPDNDGWRDPVVARIDWIAPEWDESTLTREVHLHLRDEKHRLLPGSLVQGTIEAVLNSVGNPAPDGEAPGRFVLIPKSAVLSTGRREVAWKVAERDAKGNTRLVLAHLRLGPRLEDAQGRDCYVVVEGLLAGDEVAAQGAFLIDSQAELADQPSLLNFSVPR